MTPIHLRVQHHSATDSTDLSCYSELWLCDFVGLMSQNTQLCHECLKTSSIMQEYKLPNGIGNLTNNVLILHWKPT